MALKDDMASAPEIPDWLFKSYTFGNCNCAFNCGCQFNLPSTHGFCQFVEGGVIVEGHFGDLNLVGLNWGLVVDWPGEIAEGQGRQQIILDHRATNDQRRALAAILLGEVGLPGSNHFSVFASTCTEVLEPVIAPIHFAINIEERRAQLEVPELLTATGQPIINEFSGEPFQIALCRPSGSFEFTYAEIGSGTAQVRGPLEMKFDGTYAQYCVHHYDPNGVVGV